MAEYVIQLSDGSKTINVPENVVDRDKTSIALVGHGKPNYGQPQNENFIHMLENFSSDKEPAYPLKGQVWFKQNEDGTSYEMRICKDPDAAELDDRWDKVLKTSSKPESKPTNPSNGDIWYDTVNHQFNVYDGILEDWVVVGPVNIKHTTNDYEVEEVKKDETVSTITLNKDLFETNIQNTEEEEADDLPTGGVYLVTFKVLIKECGKKGSSYNPDYLRTAAMIYRFVVRVITYNGTFVTSLFGSPNYEIIAKSDNLEFTTDLRMSNGSVIFTVNVPSADTSTETYFTIGVDKEISKV